MSDFLRHQPVDSASGRRVVVFVVATVATAAGIVAVGWLTDVRQAMQAGFIALAIAAFLPFVICLAGLLLILFTLVFAPLGALLGAGGAVGDDTISVGIEATWHGARLIKPYYRFLSRRRHPLFWGVVVGVPFGTLLLWAVIGIVILPAEMQTVAILARAKHRIDDAYKATGKFPAPTADRHLVLQEEGDNQRQEPLLDSFGRPLQYQVTGKWMFLSYRLKSYGFDGRPGRDDFCVAGAARGAELVDTLTGALQILNAFRKNKQPAMHEKLAALRALKCDEDEKE